MVLQVIPDGGGTATADSIRIPQTNLANFGLTEAEMTNNATGMQRSLNAMLKAFASSALTGVVGVAKPASPTQASPAFRLINTTYTATFTEYAHSINRTITLIPEPSTGTNSGIGSLSILDIFPNAAKVAASASVADSSLLIPTDDLVIYGSLDHESLTVSSNSDNRDWFFALWQYLVLDTNIPLRSATVASAITAKTPGTVGIGTFPANATAATNPTTGLAELDVRNGIVFPLARTMSLIIQTTISNNDTVDVNVVTT